MDVTQMQKEVWDNKIRHGFDTKNVEREFCLLYGELGEAYEAYIKKHDNLGEELADVAIYLMGLSGMIGLNLQQEIEKKLAINSKREYVMVNGVLVKKGSKDDI